MNDLTKQVRDVLNGLPVPDSVRQSRTIFEASKLFDDLRDRGLIDAPTYRLAPLDAAPPKSITPRPSR
jgi:hypothetical protein